MRVPPWGRSAKWSDVLDDLASLEAGGANTDATRHSVDQGTYALEIGIPTAVGDVVGVRHIVSELGLLSANFTLTGHSDLSIPGTATPKND
jgi:hypothetical protein